VELYQPFRCFINNRKVRKYTKEPVSDEIVKELLKAAMSATSAGNTQPWHFIIINVYEILEKNYNVSSYSRVLKEAPNTILVCGIPN